MKLRKFVATLSPFHNISAAKAATNGGATVTIVGWLTVNEWCGIIGVMIAIIGLYGQNKTRTEESLRRQEEHAINMKIKAAQLRRIGRRAEDEEWRQTHEME